MTMGPQPGGESPATRQGLIDLCLGLPRCYEDYPFGDPNWTLIRHRAGRRAFAWIYEREGKLCVNLKCQPLQGEFLRKMYPAVTPGYHMNKTYWNTVTLGSGFPLEELEQMIAESYRLTMTAADRAGEKP